MLRARTAFFRLICLRRKKTRCGKSLEKINLMVQRYEIYSIFPNFYVIYDILKCEKYLISKIHEKNIHEKKNSWMLFETWNAPCTWNIETAQMALK